MTAVVTGSDSGIGRAAALRLARAGHDVGVTWHSDREGAEATAQRIRATGRRAEAARLDLAEPEAAATTIDRLADALGGLHVFVNSAGANRRAAVLDETPAGWRRALDVNLTGPVFCARAAARRMGSGGRIVFVTSVHEHIPLRWAAAYSAAKAGTGMAAKVMALELAQAGITVNAVAPGHVATPMTGTPAGAELPQIPAGRPATADEIGALIAWLASDEAAYVTGASIVADGGLLLSAASALQDAVESRDTDGSRRARGETVR